MRNPFLIEIFRQKIFNQGEVRKTKSNFFQQTKEKQQYDYKRNHYKQTKKQNEIDGIHDFADRADRQGRRHR